jgi:thiol reductant ABC exporter CydD subunit
VTEGRARRGPVDLPLLTEDRRVAAELAAAIGAQLLALLCTIGWLLALAGVVDGVFLGGGDLVDQVPTLVAMVVLLVVRAVATWAGEVLGVRASARLRSRVRADLVDHVVAVGPTGLAHERVGEVATTIGAGVEELDAYVARFAPAAAMALVGPVVVFATIAVLDPWTTAILLFTGPMLVLLLAVIGSRTKALTRRRFDELGWLGAFYLDMIRGLATLKAFRRSREGAETIAGVSRRFGDTTMEVLRTAFQTSLVMEWAATAATALVAVQVSFRLIADELSFATALGVLVLTPEFFVPFRRLALEYHAGQAGDAALARIGELAALPRCAPAVGPPAPSPVGSAVAHAPAVTFDEVRYRYPDAPRPALDGLRLHLAPGETVALVGPSGAGKTTATRLLLRFMDPTSGHVLADGRPIGEIDLASWRRSIAWVPQDPTIIAGTVTENIRLGEPQADIGRVRAAADAARATAFVDALPEGFDTHLGEAGLRLSGGQRQRLAIARAVLRDAPLVVLDEFTAHLDDALEDEVRRAIGDLLRNRTALIIAHRPTTAAMADRAVRLVAGRVADDEGDGSAVRGVR